MALSNRYGHLVLSTGNKSEIAVGYCTLYGDMAGGYALLSDVPKTLVYAARGARSTASGERIPRASIDKPPSAELRAGPEGHRLAAALRRARPAHRGARGPLAARRRGGAARRRPRGRSRATSRGRIDRNEYKRRQMPPGPKVTARAFGEGRRYPIAQKFDRA